MKTYFSTTKLNILLIIITLYNYQALAHNNKDNQTFDSVEHKNLQLDLYLDLIRYNTQEKIGILPYILQSNDGAYLEIGTGGDPIAELLSKLPSTSNITIYASDIEEGVLQALPIRHPNLQRYLNAEHGPRLHLKQLDATDMSFFSNNSLSGINASAVVHEIISYAGGFNGMRNFFTEAFRTLKPGGVLVYRDPECVPNKQIPVTVSVKTKNFKLFTHIFIYKFLDKRGSHLAKASKKLELYNTDDVTFTVFKKNALDVSVLSYDEYLNTPSYDIDFSRKYTLKIPYGLYRELSRHYITYLHQCNPLVFVRSTPNISSEYKVHYLAHSTSTIFSNFLAENGYILENDTINSIQKNKLDQSIKNNEEVLEFGIPLHLSSQAARCTLRNLLQKNNINPCNHIISLNNQDCLLDYRVFGMLYNEIKQNIFDEFNNVINNKDEEHAKWLKREGEEFYCYLSDDELITQVLQTTLNKDINDQGNQENFVLCPVSKDHNQFIDRLCYTEILKNSLEINDELGYELPVFDGKRVIHFSKMPLENAINICKDIIQEDPVKYKNLQEYIYSLEKNS